MRRAILAAALALAALVGRAEAQHINGGFIQFHWPAGGSSSTVSCADFTGDGIIWTDCHADVDFSFIKRFGQGVADPVIACAPGTDFTRTDTNETFDCTSTNVWTRRVKTGVTLTANLPLIGAGTSGVAVGTRSGNTTQYVTTTGAQTSGDCVEIDANGNHVASGAGCGGVGGLPAADTTSIVEGSADNTKEIRFEVDGLSASTVRVITPPDADITLSGQNFANVFTALNTFGSAADAAGSITVNSASNRLCFEGSTADDFETCIQGGNPAADRVLTLPNSASTTFAMTGINNAFSVTQSISSGDLSIATGDLQMGSPAALTINTTGIILGQTASGYVVNRTSTTPDVPSLDTSTVGRSWHIREQADSAFDFNNGPCGTAACTSPAFIIQSQNQSTTNYTALEAGAVHNRKQKALTEAGGAEQVFQITTATTQSGGGEIHYKIHATDATDYAVREGMIRFVFLNIGGTVTATLSGASEAADGSVLIATAGETLTYAITADVATANVFKLMFDIDSNIATSAAHIDYLVIYNGPAEVIH